ncbi:PepSY domain-containing protein [Pseudomonas fluorescens]|uniref:Putative iron uptake protein n=1 Tax=Pseudomonas fluorescens (strain Pf0-1) TaxID=205922 RepID=Q3KHT6_PSEPF|nr:PepSY-associated TM helix domain-containing protein [Pseudomonas fluorescens]ABA72670.1 putative iron uptake protein [Pseudomonas fluorescens Pf0-1]MBY9023125.1 PepSY domain-containing protein [Pseudomonas fluorescens]MBY9029117.1 PepSY domain-containing protein [Pseudomonas fluorescens]MBY9034665.1 PepSY domain-containing protein [Pseudomonas fluorescens]MBY9040768.1 PepSY domain-containing protein [Pseudomonas fluorescens]
MKEGFRQAMAWLHTWTGLVFGWLLFAIFLTGTLAYFKDEINHWMQPEIPSRPLDAAASLTLAQTYLQQRAPDAPSWQITLPDARDPGISVSWQQAPARPGERGRFTEKILDAQTGAEVPVRKSFGGEFFYRFHFQLQMPYPWGRWLATSAAMVMFIALITGIITHKKIFKDFFTFRPRKGQRSWLDGHNAVGVLVLPFHLMITYSSLVIFMAMVMPASLLVSYGSDRSAFYDEVFPEAPTPERAGIPATLPAMAPLLARASEQLGGGNVARVTVINPGDANASVQVARASSDRITYEYGNDVTFNGVSGQILDATPAKPLPMAIAGSFYGLHIGHFAGPVLRWLYFICGLAGTAMIGTGLVIWLGKRQLKHAKTGVMPFELRLVEVLNIASMAGLIGAVAAFFWANRLLPLSLDGRANWEVNTFFIAWTLSLVHALLLPGRKAWVEQLTLAALLFTTVPLLNALTTAHHLGVTLAQKDWALAGFDLTCLAAGLLLAWAAWKMQRAAHTVRVEKTRRETTRPITLEQGTR